MGSSSIILLVVLVLTFSAQSIEASILRQKKSQHQLSPSITHLLPQNDLVEAIRTNVQYGNYSESSVRIDGKYELAGGRGEGSYNADIRSTTDGRNTRSIVKLSVKGRWESMEFSLNIDGEVNASVQLRGTRLNASSDYAFNMNGTAGGQNVSGSLNGNLHMIHRNGSFDFLAGGSASMMIGNKSGSVRYNGMVDNHVAVASVYGTYGGEKYFGRFSLSMNLLPLIAKMNLNMVERNYGTMTVTVDGRSITQKYDMRGMNQTLFNNVIAAEKEQATNKPKN